MIFYILPLVMGLEVSPVSTTERCLSKIFLLVMPKYGGKQNFSLGNFPEVGQKQKT